MNELIAEILTPTLGFLLALLVLRVARIAGAKKRRHARQEAEKVESRVHLFNPQELEQWDSRLWDKVLATEEAHNGK